MERLRGQLLTGLAIRDQDTADRAEMAFEEIIFPDHPYGRPGGWVPRDDPAHHARRPGGFPPQRYFGPQGMVMVVVGAVEAGAGDRTGAATPWGTGTTPPRRPRPTCPPSSRWRTAVRKHIPLPGKVQTDLVMGTLGPRRGSPDYMAASLGNNILGQFGMMGRIGDVVREQAGLAYHASTSLNAWINAGTWEVSAGVNPANLERAIELILHEVRRFITEPVTAEELHDSQANYIGRLPLSLESNSGVANALLNLERFQLGLDYYRRYPGMVESVTPAEILEVARRYLDPDHSRWSAPDRRSSRFSGHCSNRRT